MAGYRRGLHLPGSVVVVAGAAGAVSCATVRALATHGARPVLVAPHPADLGLPVDEAVVVPVDLTDPDAVQEAAREVVGRCGRIDGWVQCPRSVDRVAPGDPAAGGPGPGALLDLPLDEVRRLLDDDLVAAVHGARAALPHMIAAGNGVLVVVASVHGQVARPFGAPQSMASAALRAMAGALRQELRLGGARGVAVTAVLAPAPGGDPGPARVPARPDPDTPRHIGARPFPAGSPGHVAATVLRQLRRPRLEVVAGGPVAKAVVHGHALVPGVTEWLVARHSRHSRRRTGTDTVG